MPKTNFAENKARVLLEVAFERAVCSLSTTTESSDKRRRAKFRAGGGGGDGGITAKSMLVR